MVQSLINQPVGYHMLQTAIAFEAANYNRRTNLSKERATERLVTARMKIVSSMAADVMLGNA